MACLLLATLACSATPERAVLERFFAASKLYDRTALADYSLVVFEPQEQGIVMSFEVTNTSDERRTPFTPKTLPDRDTETRRTIQLSLDDPVKPIDLNSVDVVLVSKDVTVEATVNLKDGRNVQKSIVFTLERAAADAKTGRWVIVRFENVKM